MTDRPILFSAPMVRALIAGTKTQSRRVLKPQPEAWAESIEPGPYNGYGRDGFLIQRSLYDERQAGCGRARFAIGDRLWVKETWRVGYGTDWYREDLARCPKPSEYDPATTAVEYLADGGRELGGPTHPAIFMTRWASRLTLLVADVRWQRLQDITEADALAEGIIEYEPTETDPAEFSYVEGGDIWNSARGAYAALWDSLNGADGKRWRDNPWIVAVTVAVTEANIDKIPMGALEGAACAGFEVRP